MSSKILGPKGEPLGEDTNRLPLPMAEIQVEGGKVLRVPLVAVAALSIGAVDQLTTAIVACLRASEAEATDAEFTEAVDAA